MTTRTRAIRVGNAQVQVLSAIIVCCLVLLIPDVPEAIQVPPSGATKGLELSAVASGQRRWRKVSMWKAVHEMCSGAFDLADHECKKDYWAHLGDPSPAPYTSAFGRIPIVQAMNADGELVQFNSLRTYFEWRTDLEKKTSTDR